MINPANSLACDHCNAPAVHQKPMQKCSRCKLVNYCSAKCQKSSWDIHKLICRKIESEKEVFLKPDNNGLTPVHYAAIYQKPHAIPRQFHDLFGEAQSTKGLTPNQLASISLTALPNDDEVTPVRLLGKEQPLTQKEYYQLSHTYYRKGIAMDPKELIQFHASPHKVERNILCLSDEVPEEVAFIRTFEQNPPDLVIAEEDPEMGMGLMANEDIEQGAILCYLGGKLIQYHKKGYQAKMNNLGVGEDEDSPFKEYDLTAVSDIGRFSNDNPINAILIDIHKKSMPLIPVLRALCAIKKGEFINWNYGPGHVLRGKKYSVTKNNYARAIQFCEKKLKTRKKNYKKMEALFAVDQGGIRNQDLYDKSWIIYLLGTPNLFFTLHLKGILNYQYSQNFLASKKIQPFLKSTEGNYAIPLSIIPKMLNHLSCIKDQAAIQSLLDAESSLTSHGFCQLILQLEPNHPKRIHYIPSLIESEKIYQALNYRMNEDFIEHDVEEKEEECTIDDLLERYYALPAWVKKLQLIHGLLFKRQNDAMIEGKLLKAGHLNIIRMAFEALGNGHELEASKANLGLLDLKYIRDSEN